MTTIAEIRQKYPEYNDMTDQQLADSMYKAHYSDIPRDKFDAKIGLNQNTQAQQPGLLSQAGSALGQAAVGAGTELYNEATGVNRLLSNAVGLGKYAPQPLPQPTSISGQLGSLAGGAAAYSTPLGVESAIGKGIGYLPRIAEAVGQSSNILSKYLPTAKAAAYGGAFAGATSPDQNRIKNALIGAALPGVTDIGLNALASSKTPLLDIFGTASPSEVSTAATMAGNAPVGLGDILQSPGLQTIQKTVLGAIPGAGVAKSQGKVADAAQQQANKVLDFLKGDNKESEVASNVADELSSNYNRLKQESTDNYNDFLKSAKEKNIQLQQTPSLSSVAQNYLDQNKRGLLSLDTDMKKSLTDLTQPLQKESTDVVSGTKVEPNPMNFDKAHADKNTWGTLSRDYETSDPTKSRIYSDLRGAIKDDMASAVQNSNDPHLISILNKADNFYRTEVAPYFDNKIDKIASNKANLETIHNTLLQDNPEINKVVGDLSDEARKNIAFLKFKNAIKESSISGQYEPAPQKLFNSYNTLSESQKQKLFSNQDRDEIRKLGFLSQAGGGAANQHTRGTLAAIEGLGLATMPFTHGMGPTMTAAGGLAGAGLGARGLNYLLTNPGVRNALLTRSPYIGNRTPITNALATSVLMNQGGQ